MAIGAVEPPAESTHRLPAWIKTRPPSGERYGHVRDILSELRLSTVCVEARCPNLPECWSAGTATIMLLGADCSRRCGFCAVNTRWGRGEVDTTEPARVADAVRRWNLRYVVLTQVCRDDLPDGGAELIADTVRQIRVDSPGTLVEALVGDLGGSKSSVVTVLASRPDVFAHNIETVRRLSSEVRDRRAGYERSLKVLGMARSMGPRDLVTKSSIMLGLGESAAELRETLLDLRAVGVDLLTLGQYLRPSAAHLPVAEYVPPSAYDELKEAALGVGFRGVEAGPLVRSSYRAEELYRSVPVG